MFVTVAFISVPFLTETLARNHTTHASNISECYECSISGTLIRDYVAVQNSFSYAMAALPQVTKRGSNSVRNVFGSISQSKSEILVTLCSTLEKKSVSVHYATACGATTLCIVY